SSLRSPRRCVPWRRSALPARMPAVWVCPTGWSAPSRGRCVPGTIAVWPVPSKRSPAPIMRSRGPGGMRAGPSNAWSRRSAGPAAPAEVRTACRPTGGGRCRRTRNGPRTLQRAGPVPRTGDGAVSGVDRGDQLRQTGLAVRSLVLVDDALGGGLVELARGHLQRLVGGVGVTGGDGGADLADIGLELGLD